MHAAAGFCVVLERLRDSRKPAVGHNCAFDLTFTLEHLAAPLPPDWPACKRLAQSWFPGRPPIHAFLVLQSLLFAAPGPTVTPF